MAGFGLVFGAIIDEMKDLEARPRTGTRAWAAPSSILDAYQASVTEMAGMAVAIYAVQILLRMRAEEADGRLGVRSRCVGEPTALAVESPPQRRVGCAPLAPRLRSEHGPRRRCRTGRCPGRELRALIGAALVQLPAILLIAGLVIALAGLLPRRPPHSPGLRSWLRSLGPLFGAATLQLPAWAQDVSPFTHTPKLPAADLAAVPVLSLIVIAAALVAAGLASLRHHNLALPT